VVLNWFFRYASVFSNGFCGMNTVFTAGRPIRSTCLEPTVVADHTPTSVDPERVSMRGGSSRTIEDTFFPAKKSVLGVVQPRNDLPGSVERMSRYPARSKKKGSSRRPA
jgi:hypothetical protein